MNDTGASALFLRAVDGADDETLARMLASDGYRYVERQIMAATLDGRRETARLLKQGHKAPEKLAL